MNKRGRYGVVSVILLVLIVILATSFISAGIFDWFKAKITGRATEGPVQINITLAGSNTPVLNVHNATMTDITGGPDEGPAGTDVEINFTIYDGDGIANMNPASPAINFSLAGETTRLNTSCTNTANYSSYYLNFSCVVTMYWWDGTGKWSIGVSATDKDSNTGYNQSQTFFVGTTDGLAMFPGNLTWTGITAGETNIQSNENATVNNTGNVNKHININATDLKGETNSDLALWAANFTVTNVAGCEGVAMVNYTYVNITTAVLPKGDFSINNKTEGQEELAFCLEQAGSELIAQSYSTANRGSWTVKIVTSN